MQSFKYTILSYLRTKSQSSNSVSRSTVLKQFSLRINFIFITECIDRFALGRKPKRNRGKNVSAKNKHFVDLTLKPRDKPNRVDFSCI